MVALTESPSSVITYSSLVITLLSISNSISLPIWARYGVQLGNAPGGSGGAHKKECMEEITSKGSTTQLTREGYLGYLIVLHARGVIA